MEKLRKKIKFITIIFLFASMITAVLISCSGQRLSFKYSSIDILTGESVRLEIEKRGINGTVMFSTESDSILLAQDGTVTGLKEGSAVVWAKEGELSCYVTINVTEPEVILDFNIKASVIAIGQQLGVTAKFKDKGKEVQDVSYNFYSSEITVATIDSSGILRGISAGQSDISVSVQYRGTPYIKTVRVTVIEIQSDLVLKTAQGELMYDRVSLSCAEPLEGQFLIQLKTADGMADYTLKFKGATEVAALGGTFNALYDIKSGNVVVGSAVIALYTGSIIKIDMVTSVGNISRGEGTRLYFGDFTIDKTYRLDYDNLEVFIKSDISFYHFSDMDESNFNRNLGVTGLAKIEISDKILYDGNYTLMLDNNSQWYPGLVFTDLFDNRETYGIKEGDFLEFKMYLDYVGDNVTKLAYYTQGSEVIYFDKGEVKNREWQDVYLPISRTALTSTTNYFRITLSMFEDTAVGKYPLSYRFKVHFAEIRIINKDLSLDIEDEYVLSPGSVFNFSEYFTDDNIEAEVYEYGNNLPLETNGGFTVASGKYYTLNLKMTVNGKVLFTKIISVKAEDFVSTESGIYDITSLKQSSIEALFTAQYGATIGLSTDITYSGLPTLKLGTDGKTWPILKFNDLEQNRLAYGFAVGKYFRFKMYADTINAEGIRLVTTFVSGNPIHFAKGDITSRQWIDVLIPISVYTLTNTDLELYFVMFQDRNSDTVINFTGNIYFSDFEVMDFTVELGHLDEIYTITAGDDFVFANYYSSKIETVVYEYGKALSAEMIVSADNVFFAPEFNALNEIYELTVGEVFLLNAL